MSVAHDDRRLRIVYLSPDLPPAPFATGIGTYTLLIATTMARRGHRVRIVTRAYDGERVETDDDGIEVRWIGPGRHPLPDAFDAVSLTRLIVGGAAGEVRYRRRVAATLDALAGSGDVDLIESADAQAEGILYRSSRHPHVPFVVRLHGPLSVGERFDRNIPAVVRSALAAYERFHFVRASHLTVPSGRSGSLFRAWMRLGNRPIREIPNPPPPEEPAEAGASPVDPEVLFVGRLVPVKGAHALARAVPDILERCPDARFTFIGADHTADPEVGSTAERLLAALPAHAAERVRFTGKLPVQEVWRRYDTAALVALPSRFDNFPYTCLEAMARGKAIVGSRMGGMADMLDDGAGVLIDPGDAGALALAVADLLNDPARREELGRRARARFESRYALPVVAAATESFYREAVRDAR